MDNKDVIAMIDKSLKVYYISLNKRGKRRLTMVDIECQRKFSCRGF